MSNNFDAELFLAGFLTKKQQIITKERKKNWTVKGLENLREAALKNKPWEYSTGPKTNEGKAISSRNNTRHGGYSIEMAEVKKIIRQLHKNAAGKL